MQYLSLLLAAATVTSAAIMAPAADAELTKRLAFKKWCNSRTDDDGTCAKEGMTALCCANSQNGDFQRHISVFQLGYNKRGNFWCYDSHNNAGQIYCG
ncbi:hypothetical protein E4U42_006917 [Claviceps africana]|uniref:Uncharacterized protein n=1 Tax=Claviceps africana TaxID=83212 RepID=A0A8K0NGI0_9HYPO|nr:hypothetical protein E4U42_006917 [Claviceps africana]